MTAYLFRFILAVVFWSITLHSLAQPVERRDTVVHRMASVTINGNAIELLIRFDRPISHERSWLSLVRDGKAIETMHARLEAAPNVLFARIRTPQPGDYKVRWVMCPEKGDERYDGEFPLTVGPASTLAVESPR